MSTPDETKKTVSGPAILNALDNFMKLYTRYLHIRGHELDGFYHRIDSGWNLSDGSLCAELIFDTTVPQIGYTCSTRFIIPCYYAYGGPEIDIRCDVSVNGWPRPYRSLEYHTLNLSQTYESGPNDPRVWVDDLERKLRLPPPKGERYGEYND